MTPFVILTSCSIMLVSLAFGLAASLPVHIQVYCCSENGQTIYPNHPCGTHAKPVPLINNTPSVANQKTVRECASAEAAGVQQIETVRRKAQVAEDTREAQMVAQVAEQAHRDQRQKVVVMQEGVRYCYRVYVGPPPYP